MKDSGIGGYLRLKQVDPELCRSIVVFAEELTGRHNLEPVVSCEIKQALCQFAVDMATRRATDQVLKGAG